MLINISVASILISSAFAAMEIPRGTDHQPTVHTSTTTFPLAESTTPRAGRSREASRAQQPRPSGLRARALFDDSGNPTMNDSQGSMVDDQDMNREEMLNYPLPDGYDSAEEHLGTVFEGFGLDTINQETERDE